MKLNLLFFVMDLFTLLVYPVVFIYNTIRLFSKSKRIINLANVMVTDSVTPGE
jgi:hypothetical protein